MTKALRHVDFLAVRAHPHRCVLCQRVQMVACPDARARSCAIICRLCAAIISEGFEAHRLEKGVAH